MLATATTHATVLNAEMSPTEENDYDIPLASLAKQRERLIETVKQQEISLINSQPYYHGSITRIESESRLNKDGDFLVCSKKLPEFINLF